MSFLVNSFVYSPSPAFHALAPDTDNDYTMEGVLVGTGDLTTTHTAVLYAPDNNGVYQKFPANAEVWSGGRCVLSGSAGSDVSSVHGNDAPAGSPLAEMPYLQCYPAAKNSLTYSTDQGNVAWTQSAITVTRNQTGLDGTSNTACLIDDSSGGYSSAFQTATVPANTDPMTIVLYLKKDSDTSRYPGCDLYIAGTNRDYVIINTQAGTFNQVTSGGGANTAVEIVDVGGWWKVLVEAPNNSNTALGPVVYPAISTNGTSLNAGATGSCVVGNMELHVNKTIDEVRGLGPIFTTTAAVSTDKVISVFDSANSTTNAAWVFKSKTDAAQAILDGFLSVVGTNWRLNDGTTTSDAAWTANTLTKIGISAYGSEMALSIDDVWETTVAFDGQLLQGILDLFRDTGASAGQIRNLQRFDITSLAGGKSIVDGVTP